MADLRPYRDVIARKFEERTIPEPMSGCFLWIGARLNVGYGKLWIGGRPRLAHRVAYEMANGPIPDGMEIRHTCDNKICVNPAHLLIGTHADNMADMSARCPTIGRMTPDQVKKIRVWAETAPRDNRGYRIGFAAFAKELGFHPATVWKVFRNKTWRFANRERAWQI